MIDLTDRITGQRAESLGSRPSGILWPLAAVGTRPRRRVAPGEQIIDGDAALPRYDFMPHGQASLPPAPSAPAQTGC
jgi:hypothetical protein